MKSFKLFVIFYVTISYVSCSKNDHNEPSFPNDGLKVKTITENILYADSQRVQYVYTYSYDSIGRIKGIDSDSSLTNFTYSGDFIQKDIYPIADPAQHYYYYYNNDDRLDSTIWFIELSGDTSHTVYTYNTKNLVKKHEEKIISSPGVLKAEYLYKYIYDSKGNLDSITGLSDNTIISESKYTYSDSANFNDISEQVSPDAIKNPNLLELSVSKFHLRGVYITYKYKFDDYNRIEEMIIRYSASGGGSSGDGYKKLLNYTYY